VNPRRAALTQAAYHVGTGVWPLISERSFTAVTGPKREMWLVKTFGLLVTAVGAALATAAARDDVDATALTLGVGSAGALGAADVYYVARGRVRPTYLLDAAVEAALLAAWAADAKPPARRRSGSPPAARPGSPPGGST
jgi:hypothetical protein